MAVGLGVSRGTSTLAVVGLDVSRGTSITGALVAPGTGTGVGLPVVFVSGGSVVMGATVGGSVTRVGV